MDDVKGLLRRLQLQLLQQCIDRVQRCREFEDIGPLMDDELRYLETDLTRLLVSMK
jgi:hypothetical protein